MFDFMIFVILISLMLTVCLIALCIIQLSILPTRSYSSINGSSRLDVEGCLSLALPGRPVHDTDTEEDWKRAVLFHVVLDHEREYA